MNFGELIHPLISGGKKTCSVTCEYGTLKLIGSACQKYHEKKTKDSQYSIPVYIKGLVAGDTGPSMLSMTENK